MRHQQQNAFKRRLFQNFQQRIGRRNVQIVGAVHNHHPPVVVKRFLAEKFHHAAHIFDFNHRRTFQPLFHFVVNFFALINRLNQLFLIRLGKVALQHLKIGMRLLRHLRKHRTVNRNLQRFVSFAGFRRQQKTRNFIGQRRLADSLVAGNQPAVMQCAGIVRRQKQPHFFVMPDKIRIPAGINRFVCHLRRSFPLHPGSQVFPLPGQLFLRP